MKDLEQIHDIIFSKDLPYTGTANTSAQSVGNFFSSSQAAIEGLTQGASLTDRLSRDLTDAGWKLVQPKSGASTSTGSAVSLAALCASGAIVLTGVDANLINDLNRQTAFGNNSASQTPS